MQGQDSDRFDGHSYIDRTTEPRDPEPLLCLAGLRQRTPEVGMAWHGKGVWRGMGGWGDMADQGQGVVGWGRLPQTHLP